MTRSVFRDVAVLLTLALPFTTPAGAQEIHAATWGVDFPTSASGEAQRHFLNGLTAYHLYMFQDAIEEFQAAQAAEPGFAMAYWGEAIAHHRPIWSILNVEEGRAALAKLAPTPEARRAKAPTVREKAYLAALEVLFEDGPRRERELAYSAEMRKVHEAFPDDIEALALYAGSRVILYSRATNMAARIETAAMAQEVLRRNPLHPGAPRYLIQSTDDPVHAALGFQAVNALKEWAEAGGPESIHIPSHVYTQFGMWDEASQANAEAFEVSMAWTAAHGNELEDLNLHNYGHLLRWKQYADLQRGAIREARGILERGRSDFLASGKAEEIGTAYYRLWAQYVIESGDAGDVERLAADAEADGFFTNAFVLQGVGLGAARAGKVELAREAAAVLASRSGWRAQAQHHQILGLTALAEGDQAGALRHLASSVELNEENSESHGLAVPNPSKPTWELYGEVLLEVDQPGEAAEQFEKALETYRRRTPALLGAARAHAALGHRQTAAERYRELAEIWHAADSDHEGLREARRYLAGAP